jgi:predicted DNA-binding transcriptional regulator AlpA
MRNSMKKVHKGKIVHFRDGAEWGHFRTSQVQRSWSLPPEDPATRGMVWIDFFLLPDGRWVRVVLWPEHPEDEGTGDRLDGELLEASKVAEAFFRHDPSTVPVELLPLVKLRDCSVKVSPVVETAPGPTLLPIRPEAAQPGQRLITGKEARQLVRLSSATWSRYQSAGKLPAPAARLSKRKVLYSEAEMQAWMAAGCPPREVWERMKPEALKVAK